VTSGLGIGGITRSFELFKPVVAAINGYCISEGLEIALACGIGLAGPNAELAHRDVRWGEHLVDEALRVAQRIATPAPLAVQSAKEVMSRSLGTSDRGRPAAGVVLVLSAEGQRESR